MKRLLTLTAALLLFAIADPAAQGTQRWAQFGYFKASNTNVNDMFGHSVAAAGDTLVVGVRWEDSGGTGVGGCAPQTTSTDTGAVYVYVRSGLSWRVETCIKRPLTGPGGWFGSSVAISGDTLVVGAEVDSATLGARSGAAYVYVRSGGSWSLQATLKPPLGDSESIDARFGMDVAIDGDTLVVGAYGVSGFRGAAYVFTRSGTSWTLQADLHASNEGSIAAAQFGRAVALSGDVVVIGAHGEDSVATDSGAAYVLRRSGATWTHEALLKSQSPSARKHFGFDVGIDGDTVVAGTGPATTGEANVACVFVRSAGLWGVPECLLPPAPDDNDWIGLAVGVKGDRIVLGAPGDDGAGNTMSASGAAHLFVRQGATWAHESVLRASNAGADDGFGSAVALTSDMVVVGAGGEDSSATGINAVPNEGASAAGAAYAFRLETTGGTVSASPGALRFAAGKIPSTATFSSVSAAQDVSVSFSASPLSWTVASDQPWLVLSSSGQAGAATFTASIANPNNVIGSSTELTATITVTAAGSTNGTVTIPVTLRIDQNNGASFTGPIGQVDTPAQSASGVQGAIGVTGWVVDDVGVWRVWVYRNCLPAEEQHNCESGVVPGTKVVNIGAAGFVSGARPDVEATFPNHPASYRAGFGFMVLTNMLPRTEGPFAAYGGQGPLTLYVIAIDVENNRRLLGRAYTDTEPAPTTITMANDTIAKPFGAIDTPSQGGVVSGVFNNFGWALTPDSDTAADSSDIVIPSNGSTMTVFLDGMPVATVAYNQCRGNVGNPVPPGVFCNDDVANIFGNTTPQPALQTRTSNPTRFRNLDAGRAAIGAYTFDTTALANGLHTIAWSVTDSAGRNEGIGSRFFIVQNAGSGDSAVTGRQPVR